MKQKQKKKDSYQLQEMKVGKQKTKIKTEKTQKIREIKEQNKVMN